jgi:hypothetical protein
MCRVYSFSLFIVVMKRDAKVENKSVTAKLL